MSALSTAEPLASFETFCALKGRLWIGASSAQFVKNADEYIAYKAKWHAKNPVTEAQK